MKNAAAFALLFATTFLTGISSAATIYIGDDAAEGKAVTTGGGTGADGISGLTYAFTGSSITRPSQGNVTTSSVYSVTGAQTIRVSEVNFFTKNLTGSVIPFIAIYNGGAFNLGASYSVLLIGDAIAVSAIGGGTDRLVNADFLVGGVNPTININLTAGQSLVTGFSQNNILVYHGGEDADKPRGTVNDYINQNNSGAALPTGALPANLASDSDFNGLNRTLRYNVGFEIIPEPSTAALGLLALTGLTFRRTRKS